MRKVRIKDKYRDVACGECGRTFLTNEPRKLYCEPCGIMRRRGAISRGIQARSEATAPALEKIAELAAPLATSLPDAFVRPLDYSWSTTFAIPFTLNTSKNRRWSNNGRGVTYLTKSVREFENEFIARARRATRHVQVRHAKVWISVFVQKPNHKSDAVNVVDTLCDAIKKAIDLDDRWFSIDRVDWEIKKKDPQIFVRIAQESEVDMLSCCHCGGILELDAFTANRSGPMGRSRICRQCSSILWAETKKRRELQS